jgi:hypothetical protein
VYDYWYYIFDLEIGGLCGRVVKVTSLTLNLFCLWPIKVQMPSNGNSYLPILRKMHRGQEFRKCGVFTSNPSTIKLLQISLYTKDRWGHFNFMNYRFHLYNFTTLDLWIHVFHKRNSRFQLHGFNISTYIHVIREVEIVKLK